MKFCKKCERNLPLESFGKRTASPDGKMYECKECVVKKSVKWAKENPERFKKNQAKFYAKETTKRYRKDWRLKKEFGISLDDYDKMCESIYHKCEICGDQSSLDVDHCHTNGNVRGLLCGNCNRGIGLLKDNIDILQNAINYLKR